MRKFSINVLVCSTEPNNYSNLSSIYLLVSGLMCVGLIVHSFDDRDDVTCIGLLTFVGNSKNGWANNGEVID